MPLKHLPIGLVGFATRETVLLMSYWDDDSTDFSNATEGNWEWLPCCTDGGMIDVANLGVSWTMNIDPNPGFTSTASTIGTPITEWFVKIPGDVNAGTALLSTSTPVTITYTP